MYLCRCTQINSGLNFPPDIKYLVIADGLLLVVDQEHAREIAEQMKQYHDCYEIGEIRKGEKKVVFRNHILFET